MRVDARRHSCVEDPPMRWIRTWRSDPAARVVADRHYNRQSVGAREFVPPGRCMVLVTPAKDAFWITSWPFAEYVKHDWRGAWICSAFRNESSQRASDLIVDAMAATRAFFGEPPPLGMITFVDPTKVRRSRQPGRCFIKAGFHAPVSSAVHADGEPIPKYTKGGLLVLQLLPHEMPPPRTAEGQRSLFEDFTQERC